MLGILLTPLQSRAAGDDAYQADLIQRAEALNLAGQRAWWTLLHYRPGTDGARVISDADDPRFFLAPTGKNDPAAELAATLRAFFNSDPVGGDPQPAQCAFRARYHWLQDMLGFDPQRLPEQPCERFMQWWQMLDVGSVTVVFASAYLDNPASLFGHTLLRLDQRDQTERTRLLAHAINYAADDSNSHPLLYAFDGIAGGFQGRFEVQPYYKLVRTYSDLESRDLWEYRLNLTPAQLQRLLEHAWELRDIHFDYYFFRENCAWQLLTLLEAADPTLMLSDRFTLWTLPADTLRLLLEQSGLVGPVHARPARGSSLRRRYLALDAGERRLLRRLRHAPELTLDPAFRDRPAARQALMLELALDERQFRRARSADEAGAPADPGDQWLLKARNRLAVAADPVPITPYATQPETGHASRRLGIGLGQGNGAAFIELNARAAYHDLLEPVAGYTPDAQIEMLDLAVRYYAGGPLALERLTLLDITSLRPFDRLTPRPAWQIHAGWLSAARADCYDCTLFHLGGALGLAAESSWPWRMLWFGLPGLAFESGATPDDGEQAGPSLTVGVLAQPDANWTLKASAFWLNDQWGDSGTTLRAQLQQNLALARDLALQTTWRYQPGWHEFMLGLRVYF